MLVKGKEISSGSMHQWSDWVIDEVAETQTRYCSVCQNDEIVIMSDIVANVESDAEKILLLMILGSTDVALLDELYQQ
jgi:predicted lipid carrier protein YhbT